MTHNTKELVTKLKKEKKKKTAIKITILLI